MCHLCITRHAKRVVVQTHWLNLAITKAASQFTLIEEDDIDFNVEDDNLVVD